MKIKMAKYSQKHCKYRSLLLEMIRNIDKQHGQISDNYLPEDSVLQKNHYLFLCEDEKGREVEIIGFISLRKLKRDNTVDINSFYIRTEYREKKLGKTCLLLAERYCKNKLHVDGIILGVYANNTVAYNLYKVTGFHEIGYTLEAGQLHNKISPNFKFCKYKECPELLEQLKIIYKRMSHKYDYNTLFLGPNNRFNFSVLLDNKKQVVAGSISFIMTGDTGNKFLYISYYPVATNKKYLIKYMKQILSYKDIDTDTKNKWISIASEIYPEIKQFGKLHSILMSKELE